MKAFPEVAGMISSRVVSTPNGQHYGNEDHVPCDHVAVFEYPDCTRYYGKSGWSVVPKAEPINLFTNPRS